MITTTDVYLFLGSVCSVRVPLFLSRKLLVPLERRLIEISVSSLYLVAFDRVASARRVFRLFHLMIQFHWFRTATASHLFRVTARFSLLNPETRFVQIHQNNLVPQVPLGYHNPRLDAGQVPSVDPVPHADPVPCGAR